MKKLMTLFITMLICLSSITISYSPTTTEGGTEWWERITTTDYPDEPSKGSSKDGMETFDYDKPATAAKNRLAPVIKSFVSLCLAVCPLSAVGIIILCVFCRNDKKFSNYLTILASVCGTTFIVLLVANNTVNSIIEKILASLGM